jgi:hypothetical protein
MSDQKHLFEIIRDSEDLYGSLWPQKIGRMLALIAFRESQSQVKMNMASTKTPHTTPSNGYSMKPKKQNSSGGTALNLRQTKTTLPRDYTRCNDASCEQRHQCLRWLHKPAGINFSNAASLKNPDGYCPHLINNDD